MSSLQVPLVHGSFLKWAPLHPARCALGDRSSEPPESSLRRRHALGLEQKVTAALVARVVSAILEVEAKLPREQCVSFDRLWLSWLHRNCLGEDEVDLGHGAVSSHTWDSSVSAKEGVPGC